MTTKLKSAEHLEEIEVNKLLKFLQQNQLWTYYILVRLGISTSLRYSDLSQLIWKDLLGRNKIIIKEKKTGRVREIPLNPDLVQNLTAIHVKMGNPEITSRIIPLKIRTINKQLKIYAAKSGIRGKRISSHSFRKTFGREVWKRNNYSEASLVKLSQLFRHSSTSITRIYLSITKEEVENLYDIQDLFVY
jgi:integrase